MPLVLGLATIPRSNPPALQAPYDGWQGDTSEGFQIQFLYNAAALGETCTGWYLERQILGSGIWQWWNDTAQSWSTTAVLNTDNIPATGTPFVVSFPPESWPDLQDYSWSAATVDLGGQSDYAIAYSIASLPAVGLTITSPSAAPIQGDPPVTWSAVWPYGYVQAAYEIIIEKGYDSNATAPGTGTAIWQSGLIASTASSVPIGTELYPTVYYRTWLQLTGTNGLISSWAWADSVPNYPGFAQPVLTVTAGADNVTGVPMVTCVTTFDTSALSLTLRQGQIRVTRVKLSYSDDQVTWYTVRNTQAHPNPYWFKDTRTGSATMIDYESTPGITRYFKAEVSVFVWSTLGAPAYSVLTGPPSPGVNPYPPPLPGGIDPYPGLDAGGGDVPAPLPTGSATESSVIMTATTTAGYWLLKHLNNPSLSCILHLDRNADLQGIRTDRQQVVWPINAEAPIVLDDALGLPAWTINAVFLSDAGYQNFLRMRQTKDVFLLQGPSPAGAWYVRLGDTQNDATNLKSLRQQGSNQQVIRTVTFTAQAVAAAGRGYMFAGTTGSH